ncbi:MAG: histidine kinase [Spirosomataceae bacterium]
MSRLSKLIFLIYFPGLASALAQRIKIDSVVAPAVAHNNRLQPFTFKDIGSEIRASPAQNFLFIYFTSTPKNRACEYRLIGLETYFTATTNPYIYYPNLPEGVYTLVLRARGANEPTATLKIIVEGPFWQQWWFAPLVFVFILSLMGLVFYLFFFYRTQQQLHLQSVKYELEIKALRAQMSPHFIFNCLNTIDAYIVRKQFTEASDSLQKFSRLVRHILENSEFQTIGIDKEIETLRLYIELEQERFARTFRYELTIAPSLLEDSYQIPPLLLQPFVENAILHGLRHLKNREGMLSISLQQISVNQKESLFCQIEDNGIGREASAKLNEHPRDHHKSMGMNVTFERITAHQAHYGELIKTQIEDLSSPHTGTVVRLWLPLLTQFWQKNK